MAGEKFEINLDNMVDIGQDIIIDDKGDKVPTENDILKEKGMLLDKNKEVIKDGDIIRDDDGEIKIFDSKKYNKKVSAQKHEEGKESTKDNEDIEDNEEAHQEEKKMPSEKKEVNSFYSPYAESLKEDGILPDLNIEEFNKLPKEKQVESLITSYKEGIDKTGMLINYIFNGVSFGILVFCFFNLSSTMTINIFNQTKEIAIFRAMGMKKRSVTFILVVEAITLIFSSSIVGFLIGSILGYTMSIQRSLFTNIPAHFVFPSMQVLNILIVSVLGGFVCTIVPIRRLLSEQISDIIKKN